jgi:hypothetical protein
MTTFGGQDKGQRCADATGSTRNNRNAVFQSQHPTSVTVTSRCIRSQTNETMPDQTEHEKEENLVETPHHEHSAHNLPEAADSNATLEGYYSINKTPPPEEVIEEVDEHRKKTGN